MSRWCDQSIHDAGHSEKANGLHEVAPLFGTLVAETILASVHVRAQRQAGHMGASDLIKALQNTLRGGGRPHMGYALMPSAAGIRALAAYQSCGAARSITPPGRRAVRAGRTFLPSVASAGA